MRTWLANAEINLDRNLRLQYMAGLVSNLDQGGYIHDDLTQYRRFPEALFEGSDSRLQMLRYAIEGQKAIGK